MSRWWAAWRDHVGRPADARVLAMIRIALASVVVADMLWTWWLGLVPWLYDPSHEGFTRPARGFLLGDLPPQATVWAFWGAVVAYTLVATGTLMRPALVVALLLHAQVGQVCPIAEQGVDHIVRTVMWILVFSGADARWSVGPARRRDHVPAWPLDLIAWLLAIIYVASGACKVIRDPDNWLEIGAIPGSFKIMADPLSGLVDPVLGWQLQPLFRGMDWATLAFELGGFVLLTRWGRHWAVLGLVMHLGLAAFMKLGYFPWAILALYPVWFGPPLLAAWDRRRPPAEPPTAPDP